MNTVTQSLRLLKAAPILAALFACAAAQATTVPQGTDVPLVFDQALNSKHAKVGDTVRFHVARNISVDGRTVIREGAPVTGIVEKVDHHHAYGINAHIRLALNPVEGVGGATIPLEPSGKGHMLSGSRTDKAAYATGGGALLLGPVGLVGGLFIQGKSVNVHPGDKLVSDVSADTHVR